MTFPVSPSWGEFDFDADTPSQIQSLIEKEDGNPWLTLGIMDKIEDEELLIEWDSVLDIQTKCWPSAKLIG
jgi:hypothetical protein